MIAVERLSVEEGRETERLEKRDAEEFTVHRHRRAWISNGCATGAVFAAQIASALNSTAEIAASHPT